jgi:hypothetical protein
VTEPGRRHAQRAADLGGWGRLCAHQLWRADQADLSLAVYQRVLGSSAAIWWGQRVVARVSWPPAGISGDRQPGDHPAARKEFLKAVDTPAARLSKWPPLRCTGDRPGGGITLCRGRSAGPATGWMLAKGIRAAHGLPGPRRSSGPSVAGWGCMPAAAVRQDLGPRPDSSTAAAGKHRAPREVGNSKAKTGHPQGKEGPLALPGQRRVGPFAGRPVTSGPDRPPPSGPGCK